MNNEKMVMTNNEKALQLMDRGFGYLDQVYCRAADLDNMAKARALLRGAWELFHTPDEPKTEVK